MAPTANDHPLRLARIRAGMGQKELALRVGMNRSSIAAIEEGRTAEPTVENLQAIENVLGNHKLRSEINAWHARKAEQGPSLTPHQRAFLQANPQVIAGLDSFKGWREYLAPSATAFASMLGVNRAVVSKYEDGIRTRGMPDTLSHALVSVLHITNDYLLALQALPPSDD